MITIQNGRVTIGLSVRQVFIVGGVIFVLGGVVNWFAPGALALTPGAAVTTGLVWLLCGVLMNRGTQWLAPWVERRCLASRQKTREPDRGHERGMAS
jgi:hypothetical protein